MLVIIIRFSDFYVLQGSVITHLRCGGIYSNHIIVDCSQSVPVKDFKNRSLISEDMDKSNVPRFMAHPIQ